MILRFENVAARERVWHVRGAKNFSTNAIFAPGTPGCRIYGDGQQSVQGEVVSTPPRKQAE
jgi:hypothetical protein